MSFGNFWKEVGDFFSDLGAMFGGAFLAFITAGAQAILSGGRQVLKDAAMAAVRSQEQEGGTGGEKRDRAFDAVKGTLLNAGVPVVVNAIYLAIEAAVANLRAEQAKANPLSAPPSDSGNMAAA
ncbi:MAG: hypothetical protein AB7N91_28990 [Candidatus Tectimicrobiota bacterium]